METVALLLKVREFLILQTPKLPKCFHASYNSSHLQCRIDHVYDQDAKRLAHIALQNRFYPTLADPPTSVVMLQTHRQLYIDILSSVKHHQDREKASAILNCLPCSPIFAHNSKALYSVMQRCHSKLSACATFTTICASIGATCYFIALVCSLLVKNVPLSEPDYQPAKE